MPEFKVVPEWTYNNCAQCWDCVNCVGQKKETLSNAILNSTLRNLHDKLTISEDDFVLLPECRVADKYMTYVLRFPCEKWQKRRDEWT